MVLRETAEFKVPRETLALLAPRVTKEMLVSVDLLALLAFQDHQVHREPQVSVALSELLAVVAPLARRGLQARWAHVDPRATKVIVA